MALTATQKKLISNMTPGSAKVKLGDVVSDAVDATNPASADVAGVVKLAAAVANAAGTTPTKAEFDALLTSLRASGALASA